MPRHLPIALRGIALLALCSGPVAPARALLDLGPEFQVNTYTPYQQRAPAVAMQPGGSFVVTWQSGSSYGYRDAPGDSASGVFLQRFDATGAKVGDEQHVNTFTTSDQRNPRVSPHGDGSFVVVWESGCYYGPPDCAPDGSRRSIALQRFDAVAVPQGGELVVNTSTLGSQFSPAVASAPTGEFVVAWTSLDPGSVPDDRIQIVARRFAADGSAAGDDFQVEVNPDIYEASPAVAMDGAGDFVVIWHEYGSEPGARTWVRGRRFDASGESIQILVSTTDTYASFGPAVAASEDGDFVVAWQAYSYDPVTSGDIRARRFSSDGVPLGPAFTVNSHVPSGQFTPAVAFDASGNFLVSWTSSSYTDPNPSQDGDDGGIFAQAFAHDGVPLGSEFQVNVFTTESQRESAVAAGATGKFVVVWTSGPYAGGTPQDGSGPGIFARTVTLRPCAALAECDDGNPCTTDACEDGVCLGRRQPGCCQTPDECFDYDPCTDDVCTGTTCSNPPTPGCVPCTSGIDCRPPSACMTSVCQITLGRCEFAPIPGCCRTAADCDDGLACTVDSCSLFNVCAVTPIAGCIGCTEDLECSTGCLVAPETCVAGRCESPAGCPVVAIDDSDPLGAAGGLLARVQVPADAPGKGKVKAVVTGAIGTLAPGDEPSRRCKEGKAVGSGRVVLEPGSEGNALLTLSKAGARCLLADPDGALPVDVTVQVRRRKMPLSEVTEARTWRR